VCAIEAEPPDIIILAGLDNMAYAFILRVFCPACVGESQAAMNIDIDIVISLAVVAMRFWHADIATQLAKAASADNKAGQTGFLIDKLELVGLVFPRALRPA